jgi:hypothetical protein
VSAQSDAKPMHHDAMRPALQRASASKRASKKFSLLALDKHVDNLDKRLYMQAKSLIYKDKAYTA